MYETIKPMRILHVINGMGTGGAEKDIMNWYRNIDNSKYQFDFLIRSNQEFYKNEIEKKGGHVYKVSPFPQCFIKNFRDTKKFLREHCNEYDNIHVHGNALIYIYPLVAAKKFRIKNRIFHVHNTKTGNRIAYLIHRVNKLIIARYANQFLACSQKAGEFAYGKRKFVVINNAMDLKKFKQNPDYSLRKELSLENRFVVGHVGRFLKAKNHKFLIDIFKKIREKNNNAILLMVGSGGLQHEIVEYAEKMGIIKDVRFLGERNDVEKLLLLMDIMVFPSLYEGVPLVVLEAQASGTKIIYSDRIDDQVQITPFARRKSLNDSAETWADEVLMFYKEKTDCDIDQCFEKFGYVINLIVRQLINIYTT